MNKQTMSTQHPNVTQQLDDFKCQSAGKTSWKPQQPKKMSSDPPVPAEACFSRQPFFIVRREPPQNSDATTKRFYTYLLYIICIYSVYIYIYVHVLIYTHYIMRMYHLLWGLGLHNVCHCHVELPEATETAFCWQNTSPENLINIYIYIYNLNYDSRVPVTHG